MISSQIDINLIGPLKETHGYRYIVTAVDYTNKFIGAEPLKKENGKAVAKNLYKLCQYGSCDIHITDQGRRCVNSITEEYYYLNGTKHNIKSSYHLEANGLVEH